MKTLVTVGSLSVVENQGRWYLYDGSVSATKLYIAEKISPKPKDDPLKWLEKKCNERLTAQVAYLTKTQALATSIEKDIKLWSHRVIEVSKKLKGKIE